MNWGTSRLNRAREMFSLSAHRVGAQDEGRVALGEVRELGANPARHIFDGLAEDL
jgi:hypothetical protein